MGHGQFQAPVCVLELILPFFCGKETKCFDSSGGDLLLFLGSASTTGVKKHFFILLVKNDMHTTEGQKMIRASIREDDPEALRKLVAATYRLPTSGALRSMTKNFLGLETSVPDMGHLAMRRLVGAGFPIEELAPQGVNEIIRYTNAAEKMSHADVDIAILFIRGGKYALPNYSDEACNSFLEYFLGNITPQGFKNLDRIDQEEVPLFNLTFQPRLEELIKWQKAAQVHRWAFLKERSEAEQGAIGSPPWHRAMGEFEKLQDAKRRWLTPHVCEGAKYETSSGGKKKYLAHQLYEYASGRGIPDVHSYMDKPELCNKIVTYLNSRGDTAGDTAATRVPEPAREITGDLNEAIRSLNDYRNLAASAIHEPESYEELKRVHKDVHQHVKKEVNRIMDDVHGKIERGDKFKKRTTHSGAKGSGAKRPR